MTLYSLLHKKDLKFKVQNTLVSKVPLELTHTENQQNKLVIL